MENKDLAELRVILELALALVVLVWQLLQLGLICQGRAALLERQVILEPEELLEILALKELKGEAA